MHRLLRAVGLVVAVMVCAIASAIVSAPAMALPADFDEQVLADGLEQPTAVAFAPLSDGRMFIAEKQGRVKVRAAGGAVTELLDWRDRVNSHADRGMLGIATDRDFATNGFLYLLFVADSDADDDAGPHSSRLVRLTVTPTNTVTATTNLLGGASDQGICPQPDGDHATTSDAGIDCIPASAGTHAIGTVVSDPRDGTLWVGSGDAEGVVFDTAARSRRMSTYNEEAFVGKLIHIDRDGRGLAGHPFCPAVSDLTQTCTKLYAKGFRNPFRFTIPTLAGQAPIVSDVGDLRREEINVVAAGGNYGWPCWEGSNVRPRNYREWSGCGAYVAGATSFLGNLYGGSPANVNGPTFEYDHDTGAAIFTGPVVSGSQWPAEYQGSLFFADYARGFLRRFPAGATAGSLLITPAAIATFGADSSVLFDTRPSMVQLITAPNGDLVVVEISNATFTGPGRVVQITPGATNRAPTAVAQLEQEEIPVGGIARFDAGGSSDRDGDALAFAWDFDSNGTTDSTTAQATHSYGSQGVATARLTVSDVRGATATTTVAVLVGVHRPRPTITAPQNESSFDGGQQIGIIGQATDPDDPGALPDANLRWEVRLVHGDHIHPLLDLAGRSSATFIAVQDHGLDSYYRVRLIATDSLGLQGTTTAVLRPRPSVLRVASEPSGASVELDGGAVTAPADVSLAVGARVSVRAAPELVASGRRWTFSRWSDGVTAIDRDVLIAADGQALTAIYATAAAVDPGPPPAAAKITIDRVWPRARARARRVTGTVTGVADRPVVHVALARGVGARCRWWSGGRRAFGRSVSCTVPAYNRGVVRRTGVRQWRFEVVLGGAVTQRAGRVLARAQRGKTTVAKVTVRVARPR